MMVLDNLPDSLTLLERRKIKRLLMQSMTNSSNSSKSLRLKVISGEITDFKELEGLALEAATAKDAIQPKGKISVDVIKETEKAYLVQDKGGRQGWIQKRWLSDGFVKADTFNKAATEIEERKSAKQELKDFDNSYFELPIERESEKAIGINVRWTEEITDQSGNRMMWFPKSQVRNGGVPGWMIRKKIVELRETITSQYGAWFEFSFAGFHFGGNGSLMQANYDRKVVLDSLGDVDGSDFFIIDPIR